MKGVSYLVFLAMVMDLGTAQFLNNRPFPTYSLENMPDTQFSCRGKILGGYYADSETQCQMFHICVKVAGVGVQDFRFLCPNGTAFDQDHQICADWEDVDCDATTLYYSSDNFDLYRIGSGFESKALKYGEDEEVFSLQKAETGDARLNREHQVQKVNQQRQDIQLKKKKNQNFNNNNDRDIFKSSSSSHFFNNRNGGKETDEDYDDNVNANQNRDEIQKKKVIRKQQRRPQNNEQVDRKPQNNEQYDRRQQNNEQYDRKQQNNEQYDRRHQNNEQYDRRQQNNEQHDRRQQNNEQYNRRQQNNEQNDKRQQNNEQYDRRQNQQAEKRPQNDPKPPKPANQFNDRPQNDKKPQTIEQFKKQPQQPKPQIKEQYDKNNQPIITTLRPNRPTGFSNNFAGSSYVPTTTTRPSTSTTLNIDQYTTALNNHRQRQSQRNDRQYNNAENFRQSTANYAVSTPAPFKQTQQYNSPHQRQTTQYDNGQYRPISTTVQPPQKQTENYPANFPKIAPQKQPTPFKKQTEAFLPTTRNYETPKTKTTTKQFESSPKGYNTPQYEVSKLKPANKKPTTPFKPNQSDFPSTFAPRTNAAYQSISQQTTSYKTTAQVSASKATPLVQYTPTVPKVTATTPVSRSSRFDETQYDDDNSYNVKYDRREDESLRTAYSQNIANSRNELSKTTTKNPSTPKPYHESPRPFSVSPNTPKSVQLQQKAVQQSGKKVKDTSYDYAYYDTNVGSEPEYEIDTEIKKSTVKN